MNQFDTLDELEEFAEHSQSSLLYVLLHVLKLSDPQADEDLAQAASHVGVCTGIVTLLRSIAYHAAQVHVAVCHVFGRLVFLSFAVNEMHGVRRATV